MSGLTKFLMYEVEMPLVQIVADMEDAGYPVDVQQLPMNRVANSVRASSCECVYVSRKDGRDTGDRGRRCLVCAERRRPRSITERCCRAA